jgi:PAS domain S-box-containing protein
LDFYRAKTPMWIFDQKTLAFLMVNDAAVRHYGFSREHFLSMSILDIRPHEDVPELVLATMTPHEHSSEPERWRHQTRDGRVFSLEITAYEVMFAGREAELVIAREKKEGAEANSSCHNHLSP